MSSAASTVHHLIEERAQLDPAAVAVVDGPHRLSFAELAGRANRVAHHLVSCGVGPETLVGVCLPRSADLVVTILGVLKAGAAYVPIDPGEAPARRRLITQDADVRLTLTAERLAQDRDAIDSRPDTAPDVQVDPGNLAYVIYTSGSTGTPKGVLVQHSSAVNYLRWADAHYAPGAAGGVPFHSAINVGTIGETAHSRGIH